MRIIDPHLHTDRMRGKDVETLAIAGVEAGVIPTPHLLPWGTTSKTLLRMWDNFIDFQVNHSASLGIYLRVALGVPFYGMADEAIDDCLDRLSVYLKHENVVALGEIGMDAGIESEEKLFRAHLKLAKSAGKPIIVHTPTPMEPQAERVLSKIVQVIKEEDFPASRAILDHSGLNTIADRLNSGSVAGLSLCYDKLRPEDAAEIVSNNPERLKQFVINSEFGYAGEGYFSVPRAVLAMRRIGLKRDVIEQVTWENPKSFFNLYVD